jgi:Fic family protein
MSGRALHLVGQAVQADAEGSLDITENELIQALAEAVLHIDEDRDGFLTAREMIRALGWAENRVKSQLRELHEQGLLESRKVPYRDIAGRITRVPAYRLRRAQ